MSSSDSPFPLSAESAADSTPSARDDSFVTEVITGFYRVILGREPDADGLRAHVDNVTGGSVAIETCLTEFLGSAEAAAHRGTLALADALRRVGAVQSWAADHPVVSLGSHCYTSYLFKTAGLKQASGPFDWLFTSPAMIADCLRDDFAVFLDRRHYRRIPPAEREHAHANSCDHVHYRDTFGIPSIFNHRDPTLPEDFAYLQRCVERLRATRRSGACPVLVCTVRDQGDVRDSYDRLRSAAQDYFGTCIFVMVAIREAENVVPSVRELAVDGPASLHLMTSSSRWGALSFSRMIDDLFLLDVICNQVAHEVAALSRHSSTASAPVNHGSDRAEERELRAAATVAAEASSV